MQSSDKIDENINTASEYIKIAAQQNADMICFPEAMNLMQINKDKAKKLVAPQHNDQGLKTLCKAANKHKIWILAGSMMLANEKNDKEFVNRSLLINNKGEIQAQYDKLHMFDAELEHNENYKESAAVQAGNKAVIAQTPWGKCGLSICYDLRFPYLYRTLAQEGARFIFAPAAFTHTTGKKHWHILMQARAIETGSWIIAPNQGGLHNDGRKTYGHSLIVNPDGEIILDAKMKTGVHIAKLDLSMSDKMRQQIPSLQHDNIPQEILQA